MEKKEVIKKVIKDLIDSIQTIDYGYNIKSKKIFEISTFIEENTPSSGGSRYQNIGKFIFDNSDIFSMYGFISSGPNVIPSYRIWYNNEPVYSMDKS